MVAPDLQPTTPWPSQGIPPTGQARPPVLLTGVSSPRIPGSSSPAPPAPSASWEELKRGRTLVREQVHPGSPGNSPPTSPYPIRGLTQCQPTCTVIRPQGPQPRWQQLPSQGVLACNSMALRRVRSADATLVRVCAVHSHPQETGKDSFAPAGVLRLLSPCRIRARVSEAKPPVTQGSPMPRAGSASTHAVRHTSPSRVASPWRMEFSEAVPAPWALQPPEAGAIRNIAIYTQPLDTTTMGFCKPHAGSAVIRPASPPYRVVPITTQAVSYSKFDLATFSQVLKPSKACAHSRARVSEAGALCNNRQDSPTTFLDPVSQQTGCPAPVRIKVEQVTANVDTGCDSNSTSGSKVPSVGVVVSPGLASTSSTSASSKPGHMLSSLGSTSLGSTSGEIPPLASAAVSATALTSTTSPSTTALSLFSAQAPVTTASSVSTLTPTETQLAMPPTVAPVQSAGTAVGSPPAVTATLSSRKSESLGQPSRCGKGAEDTDNHPERMSSTVSFAEAARRFCRSDGETGSLASSSPPVPDGDVDLERLDRPRGTGRGGRGTGAQGRGRGVGRKGRGALHRVQSSSSSSGAERNDWHRQSYFARVYGNESGDADPVQPQSSRARKEEDKVGQERRPGPSGPRHTHKPQRGRAGSPGSGRGGDGRGRGSRGRGRRGNAPQNSNDAEDSYPSAKMRKTMADLITSASEGPKVNLEEIGPQAENADNVVQPLSVLSGEALLKDVSVAFESGRRHSLSMLSSVLEESVQSSRMRITPNGSDSGLLHSPEEFGRLTAFNNDSGRSTSGVDLFNAAAENVVSPSNAMHPLRAEGGRTLFYQASQALPHKTLVTPHPRVPPLDDNGRALVEQLFFESMPRQNVIIDNIEHVVHEELLTRFLHRVSLERATVEATFHGTKSDSAEAIVEEGLSTSICSTGNYGFGAYVATNAGTAHQYADPDAQGKRFMCIVLVVVGSKISKGEARKQASTTTTDRLVNPIQYCFVDEDRLLVSHLITYRVHKGNGKRTGGGYQDPFEKALSNAIRRAGQRRKGRGMR